MVIHKFNNPDLGILEKVFSWHHASFQSRCLTSFLHVLRPLQHPAPICKSSIYWVATLQMYLFPFHSRDGHFCTSEPYSCLPKQQMTLMQQYPHPIHGRSDASSCCGNMLAFLEHGTDCRLFPAFLPRFGDFQKDLVAQRDNQPTFQFTCFHPLLGAQQPTVKLGRSYHLPRIKEPLISNFLIDSKLFHVRPGQSILVHF